MEYLTVTFMTFSPRACVFLTSGSNCCFIPQSVILMLNTLPGLSCSARESSVVKLFDVGSSLLQGFTNSWGSYSQLTAVCCDQVLVPKSALKPPDSFLIRCSCRSSCRTSKARPCGVVRRSVVVLYFSLYFSWLAFIMTSISPRQACVALSMPSLFLVGQQAVHYLLNFCNTMIYLSGAVFNPVIHLTSFLMPVCHVLVIEHSVWICKWII
jgi:hypothetical protein